MMLKVYTDDNRRVKALVGSWFVTQIRTSGSNQIDVPLL